MVSINYNVVKNIKDRNGKNVTMYSIGEKKKYYSKRVNNDELTYYQRLWAKNRLEELNTYSKKNNFGEVFCINDYVLGSKVSHFPRRVVVINQDFKDNVEVLRLKPYKRAAFRFDVKNFDGKHNIDLEVCKYNKVLSGRLNLNDLFEKYYIYGTDNDFLTVDEKNRLKKIIKK